MQRCSSPSCTHVEDVHKKFERGKKTMKYTVIKTVEELKWLQLQMMRIDEFVFDTETNTLMAEGPNPNFQLYSISVSWGLHHVYLVPLDTYRYGYLDKETVVKYLKPAFERPDVRIIGWNVKYDLHVLARVGIYTTTDDIYDAMIAKWLCDENEYKGLKPSTKAVFKEAQPEMDEILATVTNETKKKHGYNANQKAPLALVEPEYFFPYAASDAYYTWRHYVRLLDELAKEGMEKLFDKMYKPIVRAVFDMEERGVSVNTSLLDEMSERMSKDMEQLEYEMYELAGVKLDLNSRQQLVELLYGKSTLKKPNAHILANSFRFHIAFFTDKGAPSTSADALEVISKSDYTDKRKQEGVEFCKKMLVYAKLAKLRGTFIEGLKEVLYPDNKVHASFNIVGTVTGRFSCESPNLQQLPKASEEDTYQIRRLFIGDAEQKIVAADYKNLEMMVLAHFSLDKALLETFASGGDTHGMTAVKMFELDCTPDEVKQKYPVMRQVAKSINFGLMYGMGPKRLYNVMKEYGIDFNSSEYLTKYKSRTGEEVAQKYIDLYFKTYSGVDQYLKSCVRNAKRNKYVLTIRGRKRRLPDILSNEFKLAKASERYAINAPIQGSAGDITIWAMNRLAKDERLKELQCTMLIQVHDEIVFQCPEENVQKAMPIIQDLMAHPFGENVKLNVNLLANVDFGDDYQAAK